MLTTKLQALALVLCVSGFAFLNLRSSADPKVLHDPTIRELADFLSCDTVHLRPYGFDNYTCWMFAHDFQQEALKDGFECGVVYDIFGLSEVATWGHFLNAFNITGGTVVYVEPQTANIVNLTVGSIYLGHQVIEISIVW